MSEEIDPRLSFLNIDKEADTKAADDNFEAKIVRKILTAAGISSDVARQLKREGNLTFLALEQYQVNLPVFIMGCRTLSVKISDLFLRITKTPVWDAFFDLLCSEDAQDHSAVGLVFKVPGLSSTYICHNWINGDLPTGVTRLTRISADRESVISIEPLDSFLKYALDE